MAVKLSNWIDYERKIEKILETNYLDLGKKFNKWDRTVKKLSPRSQESQDALNDFLKLGKTIKKEILKVLGFNDNHLPEYMEYVENTLNVLYDTNNFNKYRKDVKKFLDSLYKGFKRSATVYDEMITPAAQRKEYENGLSESMADRNRRIKKALKKEFKEVKVTGSSGSAYGWVDITVYVPKEQDNRQDRQKITKKVYEILEKNDLLDEIGSYLDDMGSMGSEHKEILIHIEAIL